LLSLRRSIAEPASLLVAGVEMFRALPARSGDTRAVQVLARAEQASGSEAADSKVEEQKK
jgi:flagellar motor switch protein FliM